MNVLLINSTCGAGSTGRICAGIAGRLTSEGNEVKIAFGRGAVPDAAKDYALRIGSDFSVKKHALFSRLTDGSGLGSVSETKKFLEEADGFDPGLLWLHNIHGYYINYELLFDWIKSRPEMKVRWTLHDCWAFTGHCAYFSDAGCEKWKTGCMKCPNRKEYPSSLTDGSRRNYERKKAAFTGVKGLELIVPSEWLAALVRQSFLACYPVTVVPNSVDETVFRPTKSDFRQKYGLEGIKTVLGVASVWDRRKGLDEMVKLSSELGDGWKVVLVGLSEKQIKSLPEGVLGIPRTESAAELAGIYSTSDVFVNPGREETFGMTTLEALRCGTPAVVYEGTACEEVARKNGGIAVPQEPGALRRAVLEVAGK